jgi:diadenosine tetraphosphate (Ap4A) HIT family hydrolase
LFCKIIAGEIPSQKLSETATTFAFLDIFPTSRGHALVVPKHCAEKLHEIPAHQLSDVGAELAAVAKAIVAATGTPDYNVLQNNGALAHQVVKHVHFHIIPKPDDAHGLGVSWPSAKADPAALDTLRAQVTAELAKQKEQKNE